ncbi:transcriptional regulator [Neobacillus notoginsengisoli]|uniref:Transcriptional regulator n=1 Tax=Neobacillus notoginsengisoli TaxID=1578198 RepID=A0A417YL02_9BACI|nr:metalloregulator ArsR/SmtB family transcription factor [Neobacillus notoginsengisoli]RHW34157.1 transcriptional regulator [Neobacillus notoginsengisoli]
MTQHDICEVASVDKQKVDHIKDKLQRQSTDGVAKIFKALADNTRVRIAYALSIEEELCVCDVATIVGSSVATASHHLRTLRSLGIAKFRKEGKLVYYSLDDDHVKQLIEIAFEHHEEVAGRG